MTPAKDVNTYIEDAPKAVQPKLRGLRSAIREAAPRADEGISYGMPFYSFEGETGFRARLCYFGLSKNEIVFYTRPVFLEDFKDQVESFLSTKSALRFSVDEPIPVQLIKKIIRSGVRKHESDPQT